MNITGSRAAKKVALATAKAIEEQINAAELPEAEKQKVKQAIERATVVSSEVPNTLVYWIAVGAVSIVALMIVLGSLIITGINPDNDLPNFLQTTLATAIGALAGMVVPTPKAGL